MEAVRAYIPLLVPLAVLQLGLGLFAFFDLLRRERVKGPKWAWGLAVLCIGFVGPILYFVAGRED
jgi:hypothetical protein